MLQKEFLGDQLYGGWTTVTGGLGPDSIIYSFGAGDNISWDLAVIKKFGCKIYAFDPDPKSIAWLSRQSVPPQFIFSPEGIGTYDGSQRFYDPFNPKNVYVSSIRKNKTYTDLPIKKMSTLMQERGHNHIDLLKLDIEGSEYAVIKDIYNMDIRQILVEIHEHFFHGWKGLKPFYGKFKTWLLLRKLKSVGFKVVNVLGNDYTLSRTC